MNDTQAVWATGLGSVRRRLADAAARHADARRKRTAMAVAAHNAGLSYTAIARALGVARQKRDNTDRERPPRRSRQH